MQTGRSTLQLHGHEVEALVAVRRRQAELDPVGLEAVEEAPLEPHDAFPDDLSGMRVAADVAAPARVPAEVDGLTAVVRCPRPLVVQPLVGLLV